MVDQDTVWSGHCVVRTLCGRSGHCVVDDQDTVWSGSGHCVVDQDTVW